MRHFYRYKVDPQEKRERRMQVAYCHDHGLREPFILAVTLGRYAYCWRVWSGR